MMNEKLIACIQSERIVPLFRKKSQAFISALVPVLAQTGFHTVEITMESSEAAASINAIKRNDPSFFVGAGTVKTVADVDRALDAGADFIVTPIIDEAVIAYINEKNVPFIPGAYSPSEIFHAYRQGAAFVKVFPGSTLGPDFIRNLRGPLSEISLMVTGGITLENCAAFLDAGAAAVGVGSSLIPKQAVQANDWDAARRSLEAWKRAAHATVKNK